MGIHSAVIAAKNGNRIERVFVTGASGFIGSHMVDLLLDTGHSVTGWDNLSTGHLEFLDDAKKNPKFQFVQGDCLDQEGMAQAMQGCDTVIHFAANADVRFGLEAPDRDLQQNTIATHKVLESMRVNGIKRIAFSSTGSVYGEATVIPTPEDHPFPVQTSLYGASKLAAEALISAYCEGYGFEGYVFRFVSCLGPRYTHGHLIDFYKSLLRDPSKLQVLGNGHQEKSYMSVLDCVRGVYEVLRLENALAAPHRFSVLNIGTNETSTVRHSVKWVSEYMKLSPTVSYGTERGGWVGDNPRIHLDTTKIRSLGWKPEFSIEQSVFHTLNWLKENQALVQKISARRES
jgi:UDP-glucose 4-epimerase